MESIEFLFAKTISVQTSFPDLIWRKILKKIIGSGQY
jgi:hypothetical protein